MKTTVKRLRDSGLCRSGINKYLEFYGIKENDLTDETEIDLKDILESNGVKDAFFCLKAFDYDDYCLMLADIAESVLHIFESKYPDDKRPELAIQAIRDYKAVEINKEQLKSYADAAYAASADAYDGASAAAAATAYHGAAAVYYDAAAYDAGDAYAYTAAVYDVTVYDKQWELNEKIMRKYL